MKFRVYIFQALSSYTNQTFQMTIYINQDIIILWCCIIQTKLFLYSTNQIMAVTLIICLHNAAIPFFPFFFLASFISIFFMTYLLNVGLRGHQSLLVSKKLTFNLSGNNFFFTFSYYLVWLMYLLICYNFKKKMLKILFTSNTTNRY